MLPKADKIGKWLTLPAVLGVVAVGTSLGTSAIAIAQSSHMPVTGRTSQPIGHHVYCKSFAFDCKRNQGRKSAMRLTRSRWNDLVSVNAWSNASIIPVTDMEYHQTPEFWTLPSTHGDCEDFVLMKRKMLMKRGWPASSLLVTVVRRPNGEGHAVLTVRTDKADYVLDNLNDRILAWDETPYRFLKRQSHHHAGQWVSINDGRDMVIVGAPAEPAASSGNSANLISSSQLR